MDNFYMVKFEPAYVFGGVEYKEIDLSGIQNLTGEDLSTADSEFTVSRQTAVANELHAGYAFIIAAKATGKPIAFFEKLPILKANEVKSIVSSFLLDVVSIVEKARK